MVTVEREQYGYGGGGHMSSSGSANPAARVFVSRLHDASRLALSQRRPWSELLDTAALGWPRSLPEVSTRTRKNWALFRINYLLAVGAIFFLFLLSHPVSFCLLCAVLAAWAFLYLFRTDPLVLFNRTLTEREVFIVMVVLSAFIVLLTEVVTILLYAVATGAILVAVHAAIRVPDGDSDNEPPLRPLEFTSRGSLGFPTHSSPPLAVSV